MNLKVQDFIAAHSDWEAKLSEKPYCLGVSRDVALGKKLLLLKYSQIDSDFNEPLVRECRGLILDEDTLEVICHPFNKFGNYGESYCPNIDWKSCYVTEKLDGSLIKVVKLGDALLVSTNGTIDAFKAPLPEQIGCTAKTFGDLVIEALAAQGISFKQFKDMLEPGFTYMFELSSPFNKVVVAWHETKLHFIGCRDNATGKELFYGDHALAKVFHVPQIFMLRSVDECVAAAGKLDCNHEGYVVVDKHFNRVKIKSPTYVSLHHMKNNGVLSYERGLEIVRGNELAEVLTYFPEFAEHLNALKAKYDKFVADLNMLEENLKIWLAGFGYDCQPWFVESGGKARKDLAEWAFKNTKHTGFVFAYADHKADSAKDWIAGIPNKNLVKILGYKE
jgi:hypothetical protein